MKTARFLRTWSVSYLCLATLLVAACGSIEPSPTAPSPTPAPAPSPGNGGSGAGRLEVTVTPNPVPWSGNPINEGGCGGVPNTWFYTQTLRNSGGNTIVVSDRTNYFNGREVSKQANLGITIA